MYHRVDSHCSLVVEAAAGTFGRRDWEIKKKFPRRHVQNQP
jgi:hypothetical protein